MSLKSFLVIVLTLVFCHTANAFQVAVFDYDDRLDQPDTVAKHIEKRFKENFPDIKIDQYSGKEDVKISKEVLTKLDGAGYDLIVTVTSDALLLARHYLRNTPTLYTNANNPLFLGFDTLGAPGGNISGASYYVSIERQLQFYKEIQPALKKIGFIFDDTNKSRKVELGEARNACQKLGLAYEIEIITEAGQLDGAAEKLIQRGSEAVVATSSGTIYNNIDKFIEKCDRAAVPVYSFNKSGISKGAVAALASDYNIMVDQLVVPMAKKVLLEKRSPGELPAAFLEESLIFLNKSQADKLKMNIPADVLKNAQAAD